MPRISDDAKIKHISLKINDIEWDVIDLITNKGLETIASKLGSNTSNENWMGYVAIGDGLTAPSSEDVALESEKWRKRGTVNIIANTYFIEADFGRDEPTDTCWVREVGIFDAISGGVMGARWVLIDEILKLFDDPSIHIQIAISILRG